MLLLLLLLLLLLFIHNIKKPYVLFPADIKTSTSGFIGLQWIINGFCFFTCLSTYVPPAHCLILNPTLNWNWSLWQNYGGVSSLKIGNHKLVMASTPEAVKEILLTRSADFAGRQRTYSLSERTLGMLVLCIASCNGIQGSLGFWIPRCGFRIPGTWLTGNTLFTMVSACFHFSDRPLPVTYTQRLNKCCQSAGLFNFKRKKTFTISSRIRSRSARSVVHSPNHYTTEDSFPCLI